MSDLKMTLIPLIIGLFVGFIVTFSAFQTESIALHKESEEMNKVLNKLAFDNMLLYNQYLHCHNTLIECKKSIHKYTYREYK